MSGRLPYFLATCKSHVRTIHREIAIARSCGSAWTDRTFSVLARFSRLQRAASMTKTDRSYGKGTGAEGAFCWYSSVEILNFTVHLPRGGSSFPIRALRGAASPKRRADLSLRFSSLSLSFFLSLRPSPKELRICTNSPRSPRDKAPS